MSDIEKGDFSIIDVVSDDASAEETSAIEELEDGNGKHVLQEITVKIIANTVISVLNDVGEKIKFSATLKATVEGKQKEATSQVIMEL